MGLFLGSFYNVVGIRVPKKETLLGRSHCNKCNKQLNFFELFPIIGYLALLGRCSNCNTKISIFYPIMELLTAILFVVSYLVLKENIVELMVMILFVSMMVIITVSDVYYKIVPDVVLIIFGSLLLIARIISPINFWYDGLLGGLLGFGFMYLIALYGKKRFKKDALGGGDIKLYAIIGLVLGYQLVFLSLFFAAVIGIIYSLVIKHKDGYLPFVPFIFAGSIITYFYGSIIVDWYLGILF